MIRLTGPPPVSVTLMIREQSPCDSMRRMVPDMVKKALASVKFLGTAVVLGVTGDLTINVQEELMGEGKSLIGIVEGDSNPKLFIPQLISYYKEGRFPFDRLIHVYDFNDINEAFHASHSGKVIKALLKMN